MTDLQITHIVCIAENILQLNRYWQWIAPVAFCFYLRSHSPIVINSFISLSMSNHRKIYAKQNRFNCLLLINISLRTINWSQTLIWKTSPSTKIHFCHRIKLQRLNMYFLNITIVDQLQKWNQINKTSIYWQWTVCKTVSKYLHSLWFNHTNINTTRNGISVCQLV